MGGQGWALWGGHSSPGGLEGLRGRKEDRKPSEDLKGQWGWSTEVEAGGVGGWEGGRWEWGMR